MFLLQSGTQNFKLLTKGSGCQGIFISCSAQYNTIYNSVSHTVTFLSGGLVFYREVAPHAVLHFCGDSRRHITEKQVFRNFTSITGITGINSFTFLNPSPAKVITDVV